MAVTRLFDFDITDDGEIVKYYGDGGSVVIPEGVKFIAREGVFDPDIKITKLVLPKSFLGHKYDPSYPRAYVFKARLSTGPRFSRFLPDVEEYREDDSYWLSTGDELFHLLSLDFPYLESYEVKHGNRVYQAIAGVLLFQRRCILSVPKQSRLPLALECTYGEYLQFDESERCFDGPPLVLNIQGSVFTFDAIFEELNELKIWDFPEGNLFIMRALEALEFKPQIEHLYWLSSICAVLIAPKIDMGNKVGENYMFAPVGYCYEPELYESAAAQHCIDELHKNERSFYDMAKRNGLTPVVEYYQKLWSEQQVIFDEPHSEIEAFHAVVSAILYGNVDDVKRILNGPYSLVSDHDEDSGFYPNYFAILSLAMRYGGVEKFSACVSDDYDSKANVLQRAEAIKSFLERSNLWSSVGYNFGPGKDEADDLTNSALLMYRDKELRDLKPISAKERLQCLKLLQPFVQDPGKFLGCYVSFAYLLGQADEGERYIADAVKLDGSKAYLSGYISRKHKLYRPVAEALKLHPDYVLSLVTKLCEHGRKFTFFRTHMSTIMTYEPDFIKEIMALSKVDIIALRFELKKLIRSHDMARLTAAIYPKRRINDTVVKDLIREAKSCANTEAVAFILDCQNMWREQAKSIGANRSDLSL